MDSCDKDWQIKHLIRAKQVPRTGQAYLLHWQITTSGRMHVPGMSRPLFHGTTCNSTRTAKSKGVVLCFCSKQPSPTAAFIPLALFAKFRICRTKCHIRLLQSFRWQGSSRPYLGLYPQDLGLYNICKYLRCEVLLYVLSCCSALGCCFSWVGVHLHFSVIVITIVWKQLGLRVQSDPDSCKAVQVVTKNKYLFTQHNRLLPAPD